MSLGDSETGLSVISSNPVLGDILALVSAALYAVYVTLIRIKLPDDDGKSGHVSMAQFFGYLGFFNILIFLPVALILNFTSLEPFNVLTWKQLGLIVGKGMSLINFFCCSNWVVIYCFLASFCNVATCLYFCNNLLVVEIIYLALICCSLN